MPRFTEASFYNYFPAPPTLTNSTLDKPPCVPKAIISHLGEILTSSIHVFKLAGSKS